MSADVVHDPATDWCACTPEGDERCDYRLLADAVIARLNPRDGDEAEVSLLIAAIGIIADFAESLPCDCMPDIYDRPPCDRCRALGQRNGEPVDR